MVFSNFLFLFCLNKTRVYTWAIIVTSIGEIYNIGNDFYIYELLIYNLTSLRFVCIFKL